MRQYPSNRQISNRAWAFAAAAGRDCRPARSKLRIALNIGQGEATGVSGFLDAFGGTGFQQIALSTDDIFPAAEAAKAKGVAFGAANARRSNPNERTP